MTNRKVEKIVETKEHSLEHVLGVPSGTTEMVKTKISSDPVPHEGYDEKDNEIEEDFLHAHDKALELYNILLEEVDDADPSKRARLAEVAGQILGQAVTTTEKRRLMKQHKDIMAQKGTESGKGLPRGSTTNNLFVGSFESLMNAVEHSEESKEIIESSDYDDSESE